MDTTMISIVSTKHCLHNTIDRSLSLRVVRQWQAKCATEVIFVKDTLYLPLIGELRDVFCEDLGDKLAGATMIPHCMRMRMHIHMHMHIHIHKHIHIHVYAYICHRHVSLRGSNQSREYTLYFYRQKRRIHQRNRSWLVKSKIETITRW